MNPRVIVETNFFDGIVEDRNEDGSTDAAREILRLAQEERITLATPAFSLLEAEFTFRSASKGRNRKIQEFANDERQLGRSLVASSAKPEYEAFRTAYLDISRQESRRYDDLYIESLAAMSVIALDQTILRQAPSVADRFGLSLADSVVFASCLRHLAENPSGSRRLFVTQDRRGFDDDEVRAELASLRAELVLDFRDALSRILRALV